MTFMSDASDIGKQEELVGQLTRAWPTIDILMCNAANATQLPIEDWTPELFNSLIATNLKGTFS